MTLTVPGTRRAVSAARGRFRACVRVCEDPATADAAEAVFAEVAANAACHARGPITVTVWAARRTVQCDVRDWGWRAPVPPGQLRPDQESGRGMLVMSTLADRWGVRRHLRGLLGKTVWFVIGPGTA
jgi:anti-sigma regulatory factor (Ser/Thr protein kinase)